jgi:hypothetical protein
MHSIASGAQLICDGHDEEDGCLALQLLVDGSDAPYHSRRTHTSLLALLVCPFSGRIRDRHLGIAAAYVLDLVDQARRDSEAIARLEPLRLIVSVDSHLATYETEHLIGIGMAMSATGMPRMKNQSKHRY